MFIRHIAIIHRKWLVCGGCGLLVSTPEPRIVLPCEAGEKGWEGKGCEGKLRVAAGWPQPFCKLTSRRLRIPRVALSRGVARVFFWGISPLQNKIPIESNP